MKKLSLRAASRNFFSALSLQKIMLIAFITGGIYLAYTLIYPLIASEKITTLKIIDSGLPQINLQSNAQNKPIDFYLQEIAKRTIFNSARESAAGQGPVSVIDADLTKDINLVGIISGEPPQAIIEDAKTKKNYYLTKGQFIGGLEVEDIREGKIILNYNGQSYELYL